MRFYLRLVLPALSIAALVACGLHVKIEREPEDPPPLLLEDAGELLNAAPVALAVDNSRCYVCHMNYDGEELTIQHGKAGIGCEDCHGDSSKHCGDEDNITPPDVMYPKAKINPYCLSCHPKDGLPETEHKVVFAGTAKETYCTDCHGDHRLAHRTREWDKETGVLLVSDGVRMLEEMIDEQ